MLTKAAALSFILMGFALFSMSQYQEHLPQAKPIPPNAAAMFKVLERPLGSYTGTIPISFPLLSVRSGSLSTSLSLNYNSTGGIRVEEHASCVGLGFSLADGGGRIVQMVRDKADDDETVGRLVNPVKPSNFSEYNMTHQWQYRWRLLDLEPDVFLYNIPGHNGKFFIKENGDIAMMTNDNVVIKRGGIYGSYTIFDEKGNRYVFGNKIDNSSSYSSNGGSSGDQLSSRSYYLTYMEDMNGENRISFSYVGTGGAFTTISGGFWPVTGHAGALCDGFDTRADAGVATTGGAEYLVSRIDASSGYIIVNSSADYLNGPRRVHTIEAYDSSGNFFKKYRFLYGSNFTSNRWQLAGFSELNFSGTDSLTHRFEYNMENSLPEILTTRVDIWGFYNGKYNPILQPNINMNYNGTNFVWDIYADRTADPYYAQANILTKIKYPTGGYREIIYEGNKVLPQGDFFQFHPDWDFIEYRDFTQTNFTMVTPSVPAMRQFFKINSSYSSTMFSFWLDNVNISCGYDYTVKVYKLVDSTDMWGGTLMHTVTGEPYGDVRLPNGYYRIDVTAGAGGWLCHVDALNGYWMEGVADTSTIRWPHDNAMVYYRRAYDGGGVRVKEVRDYDPLTGVTNRTEYRYKLYSADSIVTSGMLISPVDITGIQNNSTCLCQYIKVFPGSSYPLAMESSSYVVYPEVRTIDSAKGWTDNIYTYVIDPPPYNAPGMPEAPPVDLSYYRGKLLQQKVYNKDGVLLKKTINDYVPNDVEYGAAVRIKRYWPIVSTWTEFPYPDENSFPEMTDRTDYAVGSPGMSLWKTIDTLYGEGGATSVATEYQYYQYNGAHYPKKKLVTINAGQRKEQTYKYAFTANSDFKLGLTASEQTMKATLLNKFYLQPLEVVDSLRTAAGSVSFLEGAKYLFQTYGSSKLHLSSYRAFTSATDSSVINFSNYDARGNLTERYKAGDIKEVVLWGYRGLFPVAVVKGADYATVAGIVSASILNNPSSDSIMRSELTKIRTKLSGSQAQVTTYTYSPRYGMTSATDPAGNTIYYEYDLFGRLRVMRDAENYILKKYDYKLHNPIINNPL